MINRTVYNNNIHCSCLLWEGVAWQLAFQFERALSHLGRGRTVIQLSPSGNAAANAAGNRPARLSAPLLVGLEGCLA
jgi:hypothetical protein